MRARKFACSCSGRQGAQHCRCIAPSHPFLLLRACDTAFQSSGAAQWQRGSSISDINSATERLLAAAADFSGLDAPGKVSRAAASIKCATATDTHARAQDATLDDCLSKMRVWLGAIIKGRRSSFSIFANALTPDVKLAAIQTQALQMLKTAAPAAIERAALVCLRRIDVDGLYTCRSTSSECTCRACTCVSACLAPVSQYLLCAAHASECKFRPVTCKNKGCSSRHSAMHDKAHSDVCEWSPLDCVLCKLPVAACLMHVRHRPVPLSFASPALLCLRCHRSTC